MFLEGGGGCLASAVCAGAAVIVIMPQLHCKPSHCVLHCLINIRCRSGRALKAVPINARQAIDEGRPSR